QGDGRARRGSGAGVLGRRARMGTRRALAKIYQRYWGLDGGQADEGVAEGVDLGAVFGRAAAVGGSAITPRRRAALAVTAALAVAAVQDHLDVDLRGKLAREIPVQVQLLAGH